MTIAILSDDDSGDDYADGSTEESGSEEATGSDSDEDDLVAEAEDLALDNATSEGVAPANVHLDKVASYWIGKLFFTRVIWIYANCPARIGSWQQVVSICGRNLCYSAIEILLRKIIACFNCAKLKIPCIIFLEFSSNCIGCLTSPSKRACSFTAKRDGATVRAPYSITLNKYFFTMVISRFMQGLPLPISCRTITGFNMSPGIPLDAELSVIPTSSYSAVRTKAIHDHEILCEPKSKWWEAWYGVPYPIMNDAYTGLRKRTQVVKERYAPLFWDIRDLPGEEDFKRVNRYYAIIDELTAKHGRIVPYHLYAYLPLSPTLNAQPPPGQKLFQETPPQERGVDQETWEENRLSRAGKLFIPANESDYVESEDEEPPDAVEHGEIEADAGVEEEDAAETGTGVNINVDNEEQEVEETYPWEDESEPEAENTETLTDVDPNAGEGRGTKRDRSPDDPSQYSSWGGISQEFNDSSQETVHFLMSTMESPVRKEKRGKTYQSPESKIGKLSTDCNQRRNTKTRQM